MEPQTIKERVAREQEYIFNHSILGEFLVSYRKELLFNFD